MLIQCSECKSRFLAPDRAIGMGRTVRCGKCSHTWFQAPPADTEKQELPDLANLIDEINAKPKPIRKGSNVPVVKRAPFPLVPVISLLLMGCFIAVLSIIVITPETLNLSSKGVVLADVGVVRVSDKDKSTTFKISGRIANTTAKTMKFPLLRITLVDSEGNLLQSWDYSSDIPTIEAHKDVPFDSGDLEIRFSTGKRFVAELGSRLEMALRRKPEK